MSDSTKTELPRVPLATQDWALKEMMDTERRIEKAFHEQTIYLNKTMHDGITTLSRWMVGLFITMIITIIAALLFR
ncbi:MAG: hypothetical protein ACPGRX_00755 [Bdellovibrionales bacterium]